GRDFFKRREVAFLEEYVGLTGKGRIEYSEAVEIAQNVIRRFTEDESIDKVFLVYSEFKSVLSQKPSVRQLLPIPKVTGDDAETTGAQAEYIYEQAPAEIFGRLLPKQVETQIYSGILESIASEQGARMTAMDSASKNAGELISSLTLNMNRIRQAAITKEIIEVVSGAAAAQ
ncbi:MAG TPA: F0F1 ATP synthase subunit gamma, partial [Pyrinomonadaceae bacterium]